VNVTTGNVQSDGCDVASTTKESMMNLPKIPRHAAERLLSVLIVFSISACGSDAKSSSETSNAALDTSAPNTELAATEPAVTEPAVVEPTTAVGSAESGAVSPADGDASLAQKMLLRPEDIGEGWKDYGPTSAFPMSAEIAASLPSCAAFVDVIFEGNNGKWAHTAIGRNMDVAFTSVTVFANDAEAAAMVAATATPEFDLCWAAFNEVASLKLPFGITAASYESVTPPAVELGGDSSSLHALAGTIRLGTSEVPDSCVCAFVRRGRTVVAFHSAAPVFTAAVRRDLIAVAIARVDEMSK
jgi:hypothetical protein